MRGGGALERSCRWGGAGACEVKLLVVVPIDGDSLAWQWIGRPCESVQRLLGKRDKEGGKQSSEDGRKRVQVGDGWSKLCVGGAINRGNRLVSAWVREAVEGGVGGRWGVAQSRACGGRRSSGEIGGQLWAGGWVRE